MSRIAFRPRGPVLAAAVAATLLLAGCAAGQVSQTAQEVAAIDGGQAAVGQISVLDATLANVPSPGYAKGADAPLTMMVSNDGINADTLTAASSPAAGAVEISAGKVELAPEKLTSFASGGAVSITLKGLKDAVAYGRSIPVTLTFAQAGTLTVLVPIAISATRPSDRATVNIQPPELTPLWVSGQSEPGKQSAESSAASKVTSEGS